MPKVQPSKDASSQEMANTLALLAVKLPRTLMAMDTAPELTNSMSSALGVLVHAGSMNLGTLAEYEQVTPASISRTIRVLEKRGLVSRSRDEADGRGAVVQSTQIGAQMFKEGHKRKLAPLVAWIGQLPTSDRARLIEVLDLLEAAAVLGPQNRTVAST